MIGLEPRNHPIICRPTKTQKCMHLMDIALHGRAHAFKAVNQRIGGDVRQVPFTVMNSPDKREQQRVSFRIAMHQCGLDDVRRAAGQENRWTVRQVRHWKQFAGLRFRPCDSVRFGATRDETARFVPERSARDQNRDQANNSICCADFRMRIGRSARSSKAVGR